MNVQTMFDPSTPLANATVQDIHLELIRRSEHNAFHGARVLADLLTHRQDWQAVLFDTYGLATDRGLPARLLKLHDMPYNDYNADTLYILAVNEAAVHRLTALAESWGGEPHIYSQEETKRALGTSCAHERLVQVGLTRWSAWCTADAVGRVASKGIILLLNSLEVGNEKPEMALDHSLAEHVPAYDLPEALTPDGHLSVAMGRDACPSVNVRRNVGNREVPATSLGNACEIHWRRLEDWCGGPIPPALHAMAGATVPDKVLVPHTHRLTWTHLLWLCREARAQNRAPHYQNTKTVPLHVLPPVHRRLCS